MQELYFAEHEVLRLLKGRNQYLSIHNFDDVVGIGADSVRLFILPEGQVESEDGASGEKLHQARMASAMERVEKKEQRATEKRLPAIDTEQSPEQTKRQMITAVQSLAFDLIRAIDESSPPEALEQSIAVAHQRIKDYRVLNSQIVYRTFFAMRYRSILSSKNPSQTHSCSSRIANVWRRTERIKRRQLTSRSHTPSSKNSKAGFSATHTTDGMKVTPELSNLFD